MTPRAADEQTVVPRAYKLYYLKTFGLVSFELTTTVYREKLHKTKAY